MDKILNLDSVDQYNSLYGLETLNPLVSVIDLNKATRQMDYVHWNYGVYALYLKLEKACDIKYGQRAFITICWNIPSIPARRTGMERRYRRCFYPEIIRK